MRNIKIYVGIVVLALLIGCQTEKLSNLNITMTDKIDRIVVFMNSTPHTFRKSDKAGKIIDTVIYPSRYTTGTMLSGGDINSPNANIFEKALQDYSIESGLEIEVHYLEEGYDGKTDILQKIMNENGKLPDLLILNKQPQYDYYRLAEQGYLLDFSNFTVQDDRLQNQQLYYHEVMDGGKINSKQYAIPLLFSMNAMITNDTYLREIDCQIPEDDVMYEDILSILKKSCIAMEKSNTIAAIHEVSGSRAIGHYIPSILTASAYPSYFSSSTKEIVVSKEIIAEIFEVMEYYNRQEFASIVDWEENSYIENIQTGESKSFHIPFSSDANEYFGILLSGGRSGGVGFFSSLLTDVAFMQTIYEKNGKEMVFCGIPTVKSADAYAANISMAAYGMATTEYPEEVYDLVRYLMDYEFPYQYGFSVNKEITNNQIEDAQKTTICVYPEYIWNNTNSIMTQAELEDDLFYVDFLSSENAAIIQNMLGNIAGAGLPYAVLEYNMYNSMLNMVGDEKMTPEEAGEWVITQWNQYLDQLDNWEPFYDVNFNNSIQLYGDLPDE